jgi:hypothetical protein
MEEKDDFTVDELEQYTVADVQEDSFTEDEQEEYVYDSVKEFDFDEDELQDDEDDSEDDDFDFFFPENSNLYKARKTYKGLGAGKPLFKKYVSQGYSPVLIAGMLGNAFAESGFDPNAQGDNDTSYGLFQHHNERKAALLNYVKADKSDKSLQEKQIDFALKELKSNYKGTYNKMNSAKSAGEAAAIFQKEYERPKYIDRQRSVYAEQLYNQTGTNPYLDNRRYEIQMPSYNYSTAFEKSNINYTPVGEPFPTNPVWEDKVMAEKKPESEKPGAEFYIDKAANLINSGTELYKNINDKAGIVGQVVSDGISTASAFMNQKAEKKRQKDLLKKMYQESYNEYK